MDLNQAKALAPSACYSNVCIFPPKPISAILQGKSNDSSLHGEQYFEMQVNGPSNSGDILLWKKKKNWNRKKLQQPVTFGEQLGCFASEKPEEKL